MTQLGWKGRLLRKLAGPLALPALATLALPLPTLAS
jgi:hypothetical protein